MYQARKMQKHKLNPSQANVSILYHLETLEIQSFLLFSVGKERKHWPEMG